MWVFKDTAQQWIAVFWELMILDVFRELPVLTANLMPASICCPEYLFLSLKDMNSMLRNKSPPRCNPVFYDF